MQVGYWSSTCLKNYIPIPLAPQLVLEHVVTTYFDHSHVHWQKSGLMQLVYEAMEKEAALSDDDDSAEQKEEEERLLQVLL